MAWDVVCLLDLNKCSFLSFDTDGFEGDIIHDSYVDEVTHNGDGNGKRSLLFKRGYLMAEAEKRKWPGAKVFYVFRSGVASCKTNFTFSILYP